MQQRIKENLEQVRAARDNGFSLICSGQHYLSYPYKMPALFPFLARMCAESGNMRVASGITLLPLHNPVDIAETVATMDALCDGRFTFGVGLGYREEEYASFGIQRSERVARLNESMELMKLLWTKDEVEFHGKFYHVPKVKPTCKPIQSPWPPIWIAANNDTAVRRAGLSGYTWYINPHATIATVKRQMLIYRGALNESGNAIPADMPMMRELYIAEGRSEAITQSQPYLEDKYKAYADWGQDKALPAGENFSVPYQQLSKDRFLIGTPLDVVDELKKYESTLGVNMMIFRLQWPGMAHADVMKQLKLLGKYVVPQLG